jgi:hypothetical protein
MKLPTEMGRETCGGAGEAVGIGMEDCAQEVLQHCWFAVGSSSGVSNESTMCPNHRETNVITKQTHQARMGDQTCPASI